MENKEIYDFIFFEIDTLNDSISFKLNKKIIPISYKFLEHEYGTDNILNGIKNFLESSMSNMTRRSQHHNVFFYNGKYSLNIYYLGDFITIEDIPLNIVERLINETTIKLDFISMLKQAFKLVDSYNQFSDETKLKLKLEYDL